MKYTESMMIGKKFSRLTIIAFGGKDKYQNRYWVCKCDCGVEKKVRQQHLLKELTKSCGCLNTTHGMSRSGAYSSWQQMKDRCLNSNNHRYSSYGANGITVCKRWMKFENFLKDMGESPGYGYSLDRINCFGNYSPKNCRWATRTTQNRNKRNTIYVTDNGVKRPLTELLEINGITGKKHVTDAGRDFLGDGN
jgi:hypothetical protein